MIGLHRYLDGDGPMPLTCWLNRICDEYHCRPSEAWQEWVEAPAGFIEELIEARAYAAAKASYDRLSDYDEPTRRRVMSQPIMQLVRDVDLGLAQAAMDAKKAAADG